VQLEADNQIMGGPFPAASAFASGPSADDSPSAAADAVQYLRNSRLDTFIFFLRFFRIVFLSAFGQMVRFDNKRPTAGIQAVGRLE